MGLAARDLGKGRTGVTVTCDVCQARVERAGDGNMLWDSDRAGDPAGAPIQLVHKTCDPGTQLAVNIVSGELIDVPLQLSGNLQLTWEALEERARRLYEFRL